MAISQINTNSIASTAVTGAKLANSRILTTTQMPAGTIIQVVQNYTASTLSTSSTSAAASGFISSITPQFSTSKILITVSGGAYDYGGSGSMRGSAVMYRQIASGSYSSIWQIATPNIGSPTWSLNWGGQWLDSPATTSTINYQLYSSTSNASYAFMLNNGSGTPLSVTLMEIAQ